MHASKIITVIVIDSIIMFFHNDVLDCASSFLVCNYQMGFDSIGYSIDFKRDIGQK